MRLELEVSLDPTLGCGQAHRWRKDGDVWTGVLGRDVVRMRQTGYGAEVEGCSDIGRLRDYFRAEDDLSEIVRDISSRDPYVASLSEHCPGLRILRQDRWECLATYLLATNANVARIGKMVESVCDMFGDDLGGRHSFPTPSQILDGSDRICECRLGFRERRFIELAQRVEDGEVDVDAIAELDYQGCVDELMGIKGVGPKPSSPTGTWTRSRWMPGYRSRWRSCTASADRTRPCRPTDARSSADMPDTRRSSSITGSSSGEGLRCPGRSWAGPSRSAPCR